MIDTKVKTVYDYALEYKECGYSIIPLVYGTKDGHYLKWEEYRKRKPTDSEINTWFGNNQAKNIAIVCGKVSGGDCWLVVTEFDAPSNYESFCSLAEKRLGVTVQYITPVVKTARGYHVYWLVETPVKSAKFPNMEIRSDGNYVLTPPSKHPSGNLYELINPEVTIPYTINSLLDIGIDLNQKPAPSNSGGDNWITQAMEGVAEGFRDDTCTRLAGWFIKSNPPDIVKSILYPFADKCKPPLPYTIVNKCVDSIIRKDTTSTLNGDNVITYEVRSPCNADVDTNRYKVVTDSVTSEGGKPLSGRIEDWLKISTGWCSYDDIDRDLNLSHAEKNNRRLIIKRFKDIGIVEANPKNDKLIRYVNTNVRKIDFKLATKRTPLNIKFPFEIEKYFNIYSGNIVVVAGAPDAGKTGWILNLIRLNQEKYAIFYQCSEMEKEELASRLMNFEGIELENWTFEAERRSRDFADVIRPDCINIIDYLEVSSDFYEVADTLKAIHEKLESGIAIVALQKKIGASLGRGAEFSLEKPRLYLSMDAGKTTIVKAKNWVKPDYNPNGLIIKYKIVGGCKFIITENWHKPS
jgi:hypothetical protein